MNPIPGTPVLGNNSPVCSGNTLTLSITSPVAGTVYNWTGPNGFIGTGAGISINNAGIAATGTYFATATLNGCTGPAASISAVVNAIPAVPNITSNSPVCGGTTLTFSVNSPIGGAIYSWTGPNTFSATGTNQTINPVTLAANGNYNVTSTINGCTSAAATAAAVVNAIPAAPSITSNAPLCAGSSLTLNASSIASANYSWTGPGGFTSSAQNNSIPNSAVPNSGTYSVTATVNSCTGPAGSINVVVNPIPSAPAAASNSPVCAGQDINLNAELIASATYSWTGPNSFTAALQNPVVSASIAANAGNYTVSVSVNNCMSAVTNVLVVVNPIPAAPILSSNTPVCELYPINFNTPFISGGSYNWSGPGGFASVAQNPVIPSAVAGNAGTYNATVTVLGCTSAPSSTTLSIKSTPVIIASNSGPQCEGTSVNLDATNLAGVTYSWTGPGGYNSNIRNPVLGSVLVSNAGIYSVAGTLAGCLGPAATTNVTIYPIPAAPAASSNTPVCAGQDLNLAATSISNATYSWTGPNGFTSATQNPSISPATTLASGTYAVTATVNGCTGPAASTVTLVNPIPAAPVLSSNTPVCELATLNLAAANVASATFNWTGPNGFAVATQNPSISNVSLAASGTYNATVTVAGCTSAPSSTAVTIKPTPVLTASSNSPVCVGASLDLAASAYTGATYSWTGPAGFTSSAQTKTINPAALTHAGVYSVTGTLNGCTGPAATTTAVVNPIPAAPVASSNAPICAGSTLTLNVSTVNGATYSWSGPNGFSDAVQNTSLANAGTIASGTYSVTATVSNCTSPAGTIAIVVNPIPAAPVANSNSPICAGATLTLNASNISGASYLWTGPNGFTAATQNTSLANAGTIASGTYSVTATVSNCTSPAGTVNVVKLRVGIIF